MTDHNPSHSSSTDGAGLDPIAIAIRGSELTGLDMLRVTPEDTTMSRVEDLMSQMHADIPSGGTDMKYGESETQHLRYWSGQPGAPIVVFIHGGSWRVGTYLDSIGSAKVDYLTRKGYAFATINYTLVPAVTVQEQVQEVAKALKYLIENATRLNFDPKRVILMGHSSGAHVATLLGTDTSYLAREEVSISIVQGIIALDGSNYNAPAELIDSPGTIANNMLVGLGNDPEHLRTMSPTYHARAPNAGAFLLLHVQRSGDIRQALELTAALSAAGTNASLHVFEGDFFEGHMQMLLRLGNVEYPATLVMEKWLQQHAPVIVQ
jgi:acetyl esterase/lipase